MTMRVREEIERQKERIYEMKKKFWSTFLLIVSMHFLRKYA